MVKAIVCLEQQGEAKSNIFLEIERSRSMSSSDTEGMRPKSKKQPKIIFSKDCIAVRRTVHPVSSQVINQFLNSVSPDFMYMSIS